MVLRRSLTIKLTGIVIRSSPAITNRYTPPSRMSRLELYSFWKAASTRDPLTAEKSASTE